MVYTLRDTLLYKTIVDFQMGINDFNVLQFISREKKNERILFQQQQKINKTIIIAERNQNLKTSFIKNSTVSQVEHKNPRQ